MGSNQSPTTMFDALRTRWMADIEELIITVARNSSPSGSSLVPMAQYHMGTGGKRLRALIPLAVAECFDVAPERVLGLAAACEILHNATLVHDDLQDGDTVRRGQPTVWAKWGAPQAINLGDAMLYWTLALADEVDFDAEAKQKLTRRIVRHTLQVIDGQEREFLLQSADRPSLDDYYRMVAGKTSGLFALPMAATAEICGAAVPLVQALATAAGHLGVLFQLQDDVLDLYGDKGRGQRGSDLGEGKVSALVAHGLEHASNTEAKWLRDVLSAPRADLRDADVERAAELFRRVGSLAHVMTEIEGRIELALSCPGLDQRPRLLEFLDELAALFVAPIEALR